MPRQTDNCARFHIWLDVDDARWFRETFKDDVGFSRSIRAVMRSFRQGIEAKTAAERKLNPSHKGKLTDAERDSIAAEAISGILPTDEREH